jgi:hypothetical protein
MLRERFRQTSWHPTDAAKRRFGLTLAAGFPLSALGWFLIVRLASGRWIVEVPIWIAGVGCSVGFLLAALPMLARPFYVVWHGLICVIDTVVSLTLLAIMYYIVITPFGLVMGFFRRSVFCRELDRSTGSYWQPVDKRGDLRRYFRQF